MRLRGRNLGGYMRLRGRNLGVGVSSPSRTEVEISKRGGNPPRLKTGGVESSTPGLHLGPRWSQEGKRGGVGWSALLRISDDSTSDRGGVWGGVFLRRRRNFFEGFFKDPKFLADPPLIFRILGQAGGSAEVISPDTFWVPQVKPYTESNFRSEFPYIDDDKFEGSTDQIAMTTIGHIV